MDRFADLSGALHALAEYRQQLMVAAIGSVNLLQSASELSRVDLAHELGGVQADAVEIGADFLACRAGDLFLLAQRILIEDWPRTVHELLDDPAARPRATIPQTTDADGYDASAHHAFA
jgi:hypothetical protein